MPQINSFEVMARSNAEFDYFEHARPKQPKLEIGKYVLSHGFNVPLLDDPADIQKAFKDETVFFRSELAQDYDGLGGVYSSSGVDSWVGNMPNEGYRERVEIINHKLGLGIVTPDEYMWNHPRYSNWQEQRRKLIGAFRDLG